jgi:hypothetical protein
MHMRNFGWWDLAEWLDRLTANAEVATVLGSMPASSDTVDSGDGRWRSVEYCKVHLLKFASGELFAKMFQFDLR